jgi:hypothetical protein
VGFLYKDYRHIGLLSFKNRKCFYQENKSGKIELETRTLVRLAEFKHIRYQNFSSISVADPGCLSRIPDPDFYPFRIPVSDLGSRILDPKIAMKDIGKKNFVVVPFF